MGPTEAWGRLDAVLEELQQRIDSALLDIRRNVYEDANRFKGETLQWADRHSQDLEDLKEQISELKLELD